MQNPDIVIDKGAFYLIGKNFKGIVYTSPDKCKHESTPAEIRDSAEYPSDINKCKKIEIKHIKSGDFESALGYINSISEKLPENKGINELYGFLKNLLESRIDDGLKKEYIKALVSTIKQMIK